MWKNYLKITIRLIWKNRLYSVFNFIGLVSGLLCVLLILAFIGVELSYDHSYSNAASDYRLIFTTRNTASIQIPSFVGPGLKRSFPEVLAVTGCQRDFQNLVINDNSIKLPVIHSDSNFFKVFNFKFVEGDPNACLKAPNSIVLTRTTANTLFPGISPVGKYLIDKSGVTPQTWTVTGVIADIPFNTHLSAAGITSLLNTDPSFPPGWEMYVGRPQYIRLKEGTDIHVFESKAKTWLKSTHAPEDVSVAFQPVSDIHLYSKISDDQFTGGNYMTVYIFLFGALFVLVMGCANFVDLSIVNSLRRIREVGVRKVFGATNTNVTFQFISESLLTFFIIIPIVFLLALLVWPVFSKELNCPAGISCLFTPAIISTMIGTAGICGLLCGLYPAIFAGRMNPGDAIRESFRRKPAGLSVKNAFIVFQFVISSFLVSAALVAKKQVAYLGSYDFGLNKENLIILGLQRYDRGQGFLTDLNREGRLVSASVADFNLGDHFGSIAFAKNTTDSLKSLNLAVINADIPFLRTLQTQLVQGRYFSEQYGIDKTDIDSLVNTASAQSNELEKRRLRDSRPLILSENAVAALNIKRPIGQVLHVNDGLNGTIVGVIKNIDGLSVKKENPPVIITVKNKYDYYGFLYIRLKAGDIAGQLDYLQTRWKHYFPGTPFEFTFADQRIEKLYDADKRQANLFSIFCFFSIILACVGLFNIVALSLEKRVKEISMRKVVGASVGEIIRMILNKYLLLIAIAVAISIPLEWFGLNRWLANFAFRTSAEGLVLIMSGLLLILVSLSSIIVLVVRYARMNPAECLRNS
jgi:putative ABC transport system permease protein